jgi:hypothetical protein
MMGDIGHLHGAADVAQHGIGLSLEDGDFGFG